MFHFSHAQLSAITYQMRDVAVGGRYDAQQDSDGPSDPAADWRANAMIEAAKELIRRARAPDPDLRLAIGATGDDDDYSSGETDTGTLDQRAGALVRRARRLLVEGAGVEALRATQADVVSLLTRRGEDLDEAMREQLKRYISRLADAEQSIDADATQPPAALRPEAGTDETEEEAAETEAGEASDFDDDDDAPMLDEDEDEDESSTDEVDAIDRLVGRAVTLYNRRPQRWFLAVWRDKPLAQATWLPEADFDTQTRQTLLTAFKQQTGGETDPQMVGFVRGVVATRMVGRGRARRTEYKVRWLITEPGVPEKLQTEWLRRSAVVNQATALGARDQGPEDEPDSSDDSLDDSDSSDEMDDPEAPPDAPGGGYDGDDALRALVWDAGAVRAKVSIRGAIATLDGPEPPFLFDALSEWCTWRLYLLQCLAPRAANVSENDMEQLGRDLYEIQRERLDAQLPDGVGQDEHEEAQRALLLQKVRRGWRRRRRTRERDTDVLRGQLLALKAIRARRAAGAADESEPSQLPQETAPPASQLGDGPRADVNADAQRILDAERGGQTRWWVEFADPPARQHTQGNLLVGEKSSGGSRDKKARLFLSWIRDLHTQREAESRRANGRYTRQWVDGDFGSPYSTFWPAGALATPTACSLEHIIPSEWLRNGEVVRESGYSRQDITITTLVNQTENSARNDKPLSIFGHRDDANNTRLYTPPESNRAKRTRLAVATCHGVLTYVLLQQESKASGSKRFAGNFGCPEYARRLSGLRRYALADSSSISRRIALLTSHYNKWMNPLVLRPGLMRVQRYADLLEMRLRGGRNTDDPQRLECGLALLVDSVLSARLGDAPV